MILALDCSTLTLSLALLRVDGTLVEERRIGPPQRQSEVLPEALELLVKAHQLTLKDVTGYVVGLGPGSFTGLRIALATVKGLAYAFRRPAVGVSSLAALAVEGPPDIELFAVAVVKKGEVYLGRYRREGKGVIALAPESSVTVPELATLLRDRPEVRALGPALVDYRAALLELGVPAASLLDAPSIPSAAALASLATLPSTFDAQALFGLEPHYVRGSGAEENPKFPPLPGVEPKARLKDE